MQKSDSAQLAAKRLRARNRAVLAILAAFIAVIYAITLIKGRR